MSVSSSADSTVGLLNATLSAGSLSWTGRVIIAVTVLLCRACKGRSKQGCPPRLCTATTERAEHSVWPYFNGFACVIPTSHFVPFVGREHEEAVGADSVRQIEGTGHRNSEHIGAGSLHSADKQDADVFKWRLDG